MGLLSSITTEVGKFFRHLFERRSRSAYIPRRHLPRYEDSTLVAVVDTETTGLGDLDEPISVGAVLLDVSGKKGDVIDEVDAFYGLREPRVVMNPAAQRVHGISELDLRGKRLDLEHLRRIVDSADLLVAHNAKFDRRMLSKIFPHVEEARWACSIHTLKYDWAKLGDGKQSLDALCSALGVQRQVPHNALSDCYSLISILKTSAGTTGRASTRMARLIRNAWAPSA